MEYRTDFEYPMSIKIVRHYLSTAKTGAEKKVWRDLLNSSAYHKFKNGVKMEKRRKRDPDMPQEPKKKK